VDGCVRAHPHPLTAVNESDKHLVSALEYASWRGHAAMADMLLRRGANPNRCELFGGRLCALYPNRQGMYMYWVVLAWCAETPHPAPTRSRDVFGLQPLHKAVGHGNLKVAARLLADGGVDSNSRCVSKGPKRVTRHALPAHRASPGGAKVTRLCV
jgi:hypothetical protein